MTRTKILVIIPVLSELKWCGKNGIRGHSRGATAIGFLLLGLPRIPDDTGCFIITA